MNQTEMNDTKKKRPKAMTIFKDKTQNACN